LFARIYAPLTPDLRFLAIATSPSTNVGQLDRLYQPITDDLNALFSAVGLKTAA
jgi:hypothetical protein